MIFFIEPVTLSPSRRPVAGDRTANAATRHPSTTCMRAPTGSVKRLRRQSRSRMAFWRGASAVARSRREPTGDSPAAARRGCVTFARRTRPVLLLRSVRGRQCSDPPTGQGRNPRNVWAPILRGGVFRTNRHREPKKSEIDDDITSQRQSCHLHRDLQDGFLSPAYFGLSPKAIHRRSARLYFRKSDFFSYNSSVFLATCLRLVPLLRGCR